MKNTTPLGMKNNIKYDTLLFLDRQCEKFNESIREIWSCSIILTLTLTDRKEKEGMKASQRFAYREDSGRI